MSFSKWDIFFIYKHLRQSFPQRRTSTVVFKPSVLLLARRLSYRQRHRQHVACLIAARRLSHHQRVVCLIAIASFVSSPARRSSHHQHAVRLITSALLVFLTVRNPQQQNLQQISSNESSPLSDTYASFVTSPTYYLSYCQHVCLISSIFFIFLLARCLSYCQLVVCLNASNNLLCY